MKPGMKPLLEVHTHSNTRTGARTRHSHEGGDRPHTHPGTGPGSYVIDKDEWLARTGLKGGGRKKYTVGPTGPQVEQVDLTDDELTFDVVSVSR